MRILLWLGIGLLLAAVAGVLVWGLPVKHRAGAISGPVDRLPLPPLGRELSTVPGVSIKRVEATSQYEDAGVFGPDQSGKITAKCKEVSIPQIVSMVVHSESGWVFDDAGLPRAVYAINAEGVKPSMLSKALESSFGLKISEKPRQCDAYVLARDARRPLALRRTKAKQAFYRTGGPGWEFGKISMPGLAAFLGDKLGGPGINETGLKGEYDFELAGGVFRPEELATAVGALGLKLEKSRRVLKVIVIERAARAPAAAEPPGKMQGGKPTE